MSLLHLHGGGRLGLRIWSRNAQNPDKEAQTGAGGGADADPQGAEQLLQGPPARDER